MEAALDELGRAVALARTSQRSFRPTHLHLKTHEAGVLPLGGGALKHRWMTVAISRASGPIDSPGLRCASGECAHAACAQLDPRRSMDRVLVVPGWHGAGVGFSSESRTLSYSGWGA